MREVQEKKQDLMCLHAEVSDIKKSSSFRLWQLYNSVMKYFGKKKKQLPDLHRSSYVDLFTEDIYSEIRRYVSMLQRIHKEIAIMQLVKKEIVDSLYYKTLRSFLSGCKRITKMIKDLPSVIIKSIFPYSMRRKIKHIFFLCFPFLSGEIPAFVHKEWGDWMDRRKNDSCDVIIFGITAFGFRTQRPQHLAYQLAKKGHRVFYIENEFSPVAESDWPFAPIHVKKQAENVYLVKLSCARNLFIYSDKPTRAEVEILIRSLRRLIYAANIINPIAKIDHPFWGYIAHKLGMRVIYDCMDEHSGFQDNCDEIASIEDKIVRSASAVLVSSAYLKKVVKKKRKDRVVMLPNAGEFEHFHRDRLESLYIPEDIASIQKPIIGYYGAIADWLDVDLIAKASKKYSEYSFVFIGRVMCKALEELASKSENIYLLGEKPYEVLPAYLKMFDVCTIPFLLTDLIKATHPVKFFEYAASGKPIVTTALPELEPYKSVCLLARSHKEYLSFIQKALVENKKMTHKRMQVAQKNTWDMRGLVLEKLIRELMFPRVSIIVLSYNNASMTIQCLESIRQRSFYPSLEYIVVDNASESSEFKKIQAYCKKWNISFVPNSTNEGFARGNNIGMKMAKGDFIILLNNDTVVTPGWIERMVFHSLPMHVGIVGPVTNSVGNEMLIALSYNSETLDGMESEARYYTATHWGVENEWKMLAAFCWLLPKRVYKKIGGLDEKYGRALFEDDDYCLRVKQCGFKLIGADDVFIHHYGSKSLHSVQKREYARLFERNKAYFEHKWNTVWVPHHLRKESTST